MNRPKDQKELDKSIFKMRQEAIKELQGVQKEYLKNPDNGYSDIEEYREPLSILKEKAFNILLSWGGPSDGYKLTFDNNNNLVKGVYWFADWGTYAENELTDKEAELVYEVYMFSDVAEFDR